MKGFASWQPRTEGRQKRRPKGDKPKAPSQTATFGQPTMASGKLKSSGKKGASRDVGASSADHP